MSGRGPGDVGSGEGRPPDSCSPAAGPGRRRRQRSPGRRGRLWEGGAAPAGRHRRAEGTAAGPGQRPEGLPFSSPLHLLREGRGLSPREVPAVVAAVTPSRRKEWAGLHGKSAADRLEHEHGKRTGGRQTLTSGPSHRPAAHDTVPHAPRTARRTRVRGGAAFPALSLHSDPPAPSSMGSLAPGAGKARGADGVTGLPAWGRGCGPGPGQPRVHDAPMPLQAPSHTGTEPLADGWGSGAEVRQRNQRP